MSVDPNEQRLQEFLDETCKTIYASKHGVQKSAVASKCLKHLGPPAIQSLCGSHKPGKLLSRLEEFDLSDPQVVRLSPIGTARAHKLVENSSSSPKKPPAEKPAAKPNDSGDSEVIRLLRYLTAEERSPHPGSSSTQLPPRVAPFPSDDVNTLAKHLQGLGLEQGRSSTTNTIRTTALQPFLLERDSDSATAATSTQSSVFLGEREVGFLQREGYGLLGSVNSEAVYINTHQPFALVAVGVQGAGKSHSINSVIENCVLNVPPVIVNPRGAVTLVLHFDTSPDNICESVTLTMPRQDVHIDQSGCLPSVSQMTILVSPSYYFQRRHFYNNHHNCTVRPLLFNWDDLDAAQLKTLMRIDKDDNMPLYMNGVLNMLRKIQKSHTKKPSFEDFKEEIGHLGFQKQQDSYLQQRLALLDSLVCESAENQYLKKEMVNITELFSAPASAKPPSFVIVDLTDPLLSAEESNSIFQVVVSKFVGATTSLGRLLVLDEAHKYLRQGGSDALSQTIVSIVRQMRHHGTRVVVSTQSPNTLPPEFLELVSVALIHRFHSVDWFHYLKKKLPLPDNLFNEIASLKTGDAFVFSPHWSKSIATASDRHRLNGRGYEDSDSDEDEDNHKLVRHQVRKISVRQRVTTDAGATKTSR